MKTATEFFAKFSYKPKPYIAPSIILFIEIKMKNKKNNEIRNKLSEKIPYKPVKSNENTNPSIILK